MEEILQILKLVVPIVVIVIAVIEKSSKSKKQPATPSPEEVLKEAFPNTDYLQPEEKTPQVKPVRPAKTKRTSPKVHTLYVEPQQAPLVVPQKQTGKIKLSTRAEARKAFIYSEIFNRKYQ